jgi:hypothetical protein
VARAMDAVLGPSKRDDRSGGDSVGYPLPYKGSLVSRELTPKDQTKRVLLARCSSWSCEPG